MLVYSDLPISVVSPTTEKGSEKAEGRFLPFADGKTFVDWVEDVRK